MGPTVSAKLKNLQAKPALLYSGEQPDGAQALDRSIGDFIRELRQLSDQQVEQIVACQRQNGLRFGEAAIALKLASSDDVLWALSQQFQYPYPQSDAVAFNSELVAAADPFCEQAEAFREMRSQLLGDVLSGEGGQRALAVTSPNVGDGKTYFAANIAITLSQLGGRTLLIDADMRTPRLHRLFDVGSPAGLSSVLAGRVDLNVISRVPGLPSLYVLPVGTLPPNPLELIQGAAFAMLLAETLTKFNHVVLDTPAASHGSDARVIASRAGAALVIGRRGKSRIKPLQTLLNQLAKGPAKLAGVMLNEH